MSDSPVPESRFKRRSNAKARISPPRWSRGNLHTVLVRLLRVGFPVAAVLLFFVVALWRDLVPNPQIIGLEASSLPSSEVEELTMIRPRFDGLDQEGQPYTLTAERANQLDEEGTLVFMVQPAADVTLKNGRWVAISADGGRYFRLEERLELEGEVNVFQDDGYELRTDAVEVVLKDGVIDSDSAVAGQGPRGEMEGEGLHVKDDGNIVELKGRSWIKILPAEGGV